MLPNVIILVFTAGVVVSVVAHPIQDLSAVSITHKTVGNRLPRLRCGAGLVPVPRITQAVSSSFSPLYMVGWMRRSNRVREITEPWAGEPIYAKVPDEIIIRNDCFSAIKAVGRYGKVIPLKRKQSQK